MLPTYNGARYVERTVRSVLQQSFTDFEVVVSDDGSTDGTLDVLGRIDDPRLSVVADASASWRGRQLEPTRWASPAASW